MTWKLEHNDILTWCKRYDGPPAHSMICDPPYHLVSTVKRFGPPNSKPPKGGVYRRASAGMMNQIWDGLGESGKGIAFDPATWAALSQHLYPGAFIMAFASSRGWHRMAVAMEDSGLILHPTLWNYWSYLSGFPKATRIKGEGSAVFSGHRYGLQALKPSIEPIIVAQVPYSGRPVDSIVVTGAGALNIDAGRIGTRADAPQRMGSKTTSTVYGNIDTDGGKLYSEGRWPANFILTHTYYPVMRLTGNQPSGIISDIRRYFNGYTRVSELRQRGLHHSVQTQCGAEVLQPSLQIRGSKNQPDPNQGNPDLPILPGGILDSSVLGSHGASEILQPKLQKQVFKATDGRIISETGNTSHARIERQNLENQEGKGGSTEKGESPSLEGGQNERSRVYIRDDRPAAPRSTRDGSQDETKGDLHLGASASNGNEAGPPAKENRDGTPHQREQERERTGESSDNGPDASLHATPGSGKGISVSAGGERPLEVLACDIPNEWYRYFEHTGENLGCNGECHPDCPVRLFDEQAGERPAGGSTMATDEPLTKNVYGKKKVSNFSSYQDDGPASRMFYRSDWAYEVAEQLANAAPVRYEPKVSSSEREAGLDELETRTRHRVNAGGLENEPRFAPTQVKNNHPCLKPINLLIYLSKLLAPPEAYAPRRILIPFSGSGSEICGVLLSGCWEEAIGIEMSAEYCKIAEARVKYWDSVKEKVWARGLDSILESYGKTDRATSDSQLRLPF